MCMGRRATKVHKGIRDAQEVGWWGGWHCWHTEASAVCMGRRARPAHRGKIRQELRKGGAERASGSSCRGRDATAATAVEAEMLPQPQQLRQRCYRSHSS